MSREGPDLAREPGPPDLGPGLSLPDMASAVGVPRGALWHARELGLLPPPDVGAGRWSAADVRDIQQRWPQIASAIEAARELGAGRCAELLARTTGLAVRQIHVERLADRGVLTPTRTYRRRPLYRVADVQALADDPLSRALLSEIVSDRAPAGADGQAR
jgi:hypothetical protein